MNSEGILKAVVDCKVAYGIIEKPIVADYVQQTEVSEGRLYWLVIQMKNFGCYENLVWVCVITRKRTCMSRESYRNRH